MIPASLLLYLHQAEVTRVFSGSLVLCVTDGARHTLDTSYSYRLFDMFSFFVVLLVLVSSATGDTRGLDAAHGLASLLDASHSLAYTQYANGSANSFSMLKRHWLKHVCHTLPFALPHRENRGFNHLRRAMCQ